MSYADQREQEAQKAAAAGQLPYLSGDERKQLDRYLTATENFPKKFWSAIADHIAVNGLEIPFSQIRGGTQFRPRVAINGSAIGIGGTTYTTDANGPELAGLSAGTWLFLYGFQSATNTGNNPGYGLISPSINGATPSDGDAVQTRNLLGSDAPSVSTEDRTEGSCIYFKFTELEESSDVELQYRVTDGSLTATNVYLIAIKISN